MAHPCYVLFYDRTLVQVFGDVVSSCADQLYPSLVSLVIGFGPGKRWKKRMMNIDYGATDLFKKSRRLDLHVSSENDKFCSMLSEPSKLFGFVFGFGLRRHWEMTKR